MQPKGQSYPQHLHNRSAWNAAGLQNRTAAKLCGCGGEGKENTVPWPLHPQDDAYPCHRSRPKVLVGATEHNTQLFKCSEPITLPFWKRLYTLRAERGNQGSVTICNVDVATVGYTAIRTEFPHNTLVMVKAHSSIRTCTWWQIPLLQVQPAPLIRENPGQTLTCWPSVQHKQQTWCSWYASNLTRACSLITESVCAQSNVSGTQTGCTSAHQRCGGSSTEKEHQAY